MFKFMEGKKNASIIREYLKISCPINLAKNKLPSPIFNYIDGASDDEITYKRNTTSYEEVDLIPNVLKGVENIDISTTIFGSILASSQASNELSTDSLTAVINDL